MSWSEIIFWLFARLRPLLAYHARLGWLLRVAARVFDDDETLHWLADNPEGRAHTEAILADAEHCLDTIVGLRAMELLGLPAFAIRRQRARIHTAPSLERLATRFAWLAYRYDHIERLARLRAAKLRREMEAPILLAPNHAPPSEARPAPCATPRFIAVPRVVVRDITWSRGLPAPPWPCHA